MKREHAIQIQKEIDRIHLEDAMFKSKLIPYMKFCLGVMAILLSIAAIKLISII